MLTEKEKALLAYGYCVGKELGHNETVEGCFWGNGRPVVHIDSAKDFIEELDKNDIDGAVYDWEERFIIGNTDK